MRSARPTPSVGLAAGGLPVVALAAWEPLAGLGLLTLLVLLHVATAPLVSEAITSPPAPTDAALVIERELGRSRRHRRPCSLVRVSGQRGDLPALCGSLRRSDQAWRVGRDVIILMPESSRDSANIGVRRLCSDATSVVATFPDDGLTVQALVDAVLARPRSERTTEPLVIPELGPQVEPIWPS
jgi:hypothetical protein